MRNKIIKNYYINSNIGDIIITIHFYKNSLVLLYLYNDELKQYKTNYYSYRNNELLFENNIFCNTDILFHDLKLNVRFDNNKKQNIFYNNISIVQCYGELNNVEFTGNIYIDEERFFNFPYEYKKIIGFNVDDYNSIFSYSNYLFDNKSKIILYTNINNNLIRENNSLIFKKKENEIAFKSYQNIYHINYEESKTISLPNNKLNFKKAEVDFSINKILQDPFVKIKKDMIVISYKY